jgi:hypothetical protein
MDTQSVDLGPSGPIDSAPLKRAGRPPRSLDAETWWPVFVDAYKRTGSLALAAEEAGVSEPTARRYRLADPERGREIRRARRYFRQSLEYLLVQLGRGDVKGQAIPVLARLKATGRKMAERYSEKAVDARVMNLTIHAGQSAPPDAEGLLQRMFQSMGHDERHVMLGQAYELPPAIIETERERRRHESDDHRLGPTHPTAP